MMKTDQSADPLGHSFDKFSAQPNPLRTSFAVCRDEKLQAQGRIENQQMEFVM